VALHDETPADWLDMSAHFYITESDLGFTRAQISAPKLAELNPYVPVSVLTGELTKALVTGYTVIVLIDQPLHKITDIANYCHSAGIIVIVSDVRGVFGSIFCDFGASFVVSDTNGEQIANAMIAGVTKDFPALVTVLEETRHGLETGDKVVLSEIVGMEELNGKEFLITVKDPFSFEIPVDTTGCVAYERGGYMKEVKQPVTLSFEPWAVAVKQPGEFICDFGKLHRAGALHIGFRALQMYQEREGSLPEPGNISHSDLVYKMAADINSEAAAESGSFHLSVEELKEHETLIKR
jgi:ubiquitin-activating enzyme E1